MTRLGIDLRGLAATTFANDCAFATIKVVTQGEWKPGLDAGHETTTREHKGRAYKIYFDSSDIDGTTVRHEDCRIRVYRATLPNGVEPTTKDRLSFGGIDYEIVHVGGDEACFEIHARGPGHA